MFHRQHSHSNLLFLFIFVLLDAVVGARCVPGDIATTSDSNSVFCSFFIWLFSYNVVYIRVLSGAIIFGSDQEVREVMRAVRRNNATGMFSWIGSDGWSARNLVSDGNEPEVSRECRVFAFIERTALTRKLRKSREREKNNRRFGRFTLAMRSFNLVAVSVLHT